MIHLEFNSESENEGIARVVTAAYIMKFDPDMEEMDDIKTAVSEAVTNCIVHAYSDTKGKITMDLSDQDGILKIEIKDHGVVRMLVTLFDFSYLALSKLNLTEVEESALPPH